MIAASRGIERQYELGVGTTVLHLIMAGAPNPATKSDRSAEWQTLRNRLTEVVGYVWDTDQEPYHSSFGKDLLFCHMVIWKTSRVHVAIPCIDANCAIKDNWHFLGQQVQHDAPKSTFRTSPSRMPDASRPPLRPHKASNSDSSSHSTLVASDSRTPQTTRVVARVSSHVLRLEREFQLAKLVTSQSDPLCKHFIRPVELVRLPPRYRNEALAVSIFESPGPNYLRELVEFGPNWYKISTEDRLSVPVDGGRPQSAKTPLPLFLAFAIGATECLEILHHDNRIIHGEIRGDVFHFNHETVAVKMLNFGSGARSFEGGLMTANWDSLSRQVSPVPLAGRNLEEVVGPELI